MKLLSFTLLKHLISIVFLLLCSGLVLAQQEISGIIYDQDTKQRVAKVYVYNTNNDQGVFNNLKGEFKLQASAGDVLIAATEGYFPDTLRVQEENILVLYLRRSSIMLREVSVVARKSPEEILAQKKEDYNVAYRRGDPGSLLSTGHSGAGLSIDALYSILSREGKNARYLQQIIERDYQNDIIDYRYTADLVHTNTGLEGDALRDFMEQYRPSYYFILESNDYELAVFIRRNFQQYRKNPHARRLPPLEEVPVQELDELRTPK
ncbi:peptidase associated/transthyretin-like domain-containing protein [Albibacterium indicum]|uniref:hypothetical protein n=1 Tax=Albibacterium indicum TaxID=2292082 RepID=UPI000E4B7B71|nr:hypothetical protein [Pedobacter indicus]